MALRFRKRIRIAPGISINVTQKGITSATVGPKGANVNIGKKGSYLNAGIPGTGIYSRTQVSKPKVAGSKPSSVRPAPKAEAKQGVWSGIIAILLVVIFFAWLL